MRELEKNTAALHDKLPSELERYLTEKDEQRRRLGSLLDRLRIINSRATGNGQTGEQDISPVPSTYISKMRQDADETVFIINAIADEIAVLEEFV